MKRPRRWLEIDGKVNTISGHGQEYGIGRSKLDWQAAKHNVKRSHLSLEVLSEIFGSPVTEAEKPNNWQEIMYGSKRGAQKDVPKGTKKNTYAARKAKEIESVNKPVQMFLGMQLVSNPCQFASYY